MSRTARLSIAFALLLSLQVPGIIPLDIVQEVAAQGASPSFGAAGTAAWNAYSWQTPGAGEPTMGVAWNLPGGLTSTGAPNTGTTALFEARLSQWKVDFDDSVNPPTATVTDVRHGGLQQALGFDPIMFTDVYTGRSWAGELQVVSPAIAGAPAAQPSVGCTELYYTDDNGGAWTTAYACMPYWFDHETVGAGPWPAGGPYLGPIGGQQLPAGLPPANPAVNIFPSAVYYCAQAASAGIITECEVSLDGGTTYIPTAPPWGSPVPMFGGAGNCGGLHGHIRVAPDGTAMLPNKSCNGAASFAVTYDNGQTWAIRSPPGAGTGPFDPSVAASYRTPAAHGLAPPTGDHYTYFGMAQTNGAFIGVSADDGVTWNTNLGTGNGAPANQRWIDVGQFANPPVLRAEFAEVIAGDYNRAAFAFLGSTDAAPTNGACNGPARVHVWYQYVAMTYDAGITWDVQRVSNDPVQRGRIWDGGGGTICRNLLDFQDIVVDAYGRVLIAQADGCTGQCVTAPANTAYCDTGAPLGSCDARATIVRQTTGRGLFAEFDTTGVPVVPTAGGPCPPVATPNLMIDSPPDGSLVTTAQPPFDGHVERNNAGPTLQAFANAPMTSPYVGQAYTPIPIVGTANCFTGVYTCAWSPVGSTVPTFTPTANTCSPSVTYYTPGFFALQLTVYDPGTGQTATDIGYVQVTQNGGAVVPPPPVFPPCLPSGIQFDDDPDNGDPPPAADDHLNPGPNHGSGVNEFTCFGGFFAGQNFDFHLSVADSLLPTHQMGTAPNFSGSAMEYYWIRFTPTYGIYQGVPQTIQIMWDRLNAAAVDACFLLVVTQFANQGLGTYVRTGQRPETLCDPARAVTAQWVGNTIVASFDILDISPLGVTVGGEFQATYGWAWHFSESTAWDMPPSQTSLNQNALGLGIISVTGCVNPAGANCGVAEEDDFTPSCNNGSDPPTQGVTIRFVSPTAIGVSYSCNPNGPVTINAPVFALGDLMDDVRKAIEDFPTPAQLIAVGAPLPASPPGLPGIPGSVSLPSVLNTLGLPPLTLPSLPIGGPSQIAPPTTPAPLSSSSTPCPVAPPSPVYYEFVRLAPSWGPAVWVGVNTQNQNYDTWTTLLDAFTSADNGWQALDGVWCEGVQSGTGPVQWVLLDTDHIDLYIDMPGQSGLSQQEGFIADEDPGTGDDIDKDGVKDSADNCVVDPNPLQTDTDDDGAGDACDPDIDGDGVPQGPDNCPFRPNPDLQDHDDDEIGDACDLDDDNDGVMDQNADFTPAVPTDNCPYFPNIGQQDIDGDGRGDLCDDDLDNDGVRDFEDFFPDDPARIVDEANSAKTPTGTATPLAGGIGDAPTKEKASTNPIVYAAYAFFGALVAGILVVVIVAARRRGQA